MTNWMLISLACLPGADVSSPATGRMIQQLHAKDWILRADALEYLASHRAREAAKPIRQIVLDEKAQPWLRGRALVALARIEPSNLLSLIKQFSQHKSTRLQAAAAESIQYLPRKALDQSLQALLKDSEMEVRYRALSSFAEHQKDKAWSSVDPLTRELKASVVRWGARALAFVGTKEAMERLRKLAMKSEFQKGILRGILGVPNPKLIGVLLPVLVHVDVNDQRFATGISALQQFDKAEVERELKAQLSTGDARTIRAISSIIVVLRRPELANPLRMAMSRIKDLKTLEVVLSTLARRFMRPDDHQELFIQQLKNENVAIRTLAIRGLAHCSRLNLYQKLELTMEDKSPAIVEAALGALQRAPIENAPKGKLVEYLKTPLKSERPDIRKLAYTLLTHAGTNADFKSALDLMGAQLRSTDVEVRSEAAEVLGKLATENQFQTVVRAQGYVTQWRVIGTFYNGPTNEGFNKPYPPEEKIDFNAKYKAKYAWVLRGGQRKKADLERTVQWTKASVEKTDGKLIMPPILPPPAVQAVAYVVADIQIESATEAVLSVDGDDAFRVWLNDKKVAEKVGPDIRRHPNVAEQLGIKVTLKAGRNRFIVKTSNLMEEWWIRLRLTDKKGQPIEFQP